MWLPWPAPAQSPAFLWGGRLLSVFAHQLQAHLDTISFLDPYPSAFQTEQQFSKLQL